MNFFLTFLAIVGLLAAVLAESTKEHCDAPTGPQIIPYPQPEKFSTFAEERLHRKQRLAAACRVFSKYDLDEGVAGLVTVRDPEFTDTFWVNAFVLPMGMVSVSNLVRVDEHGAVIEGNLAVNLAALPLQVQMHKARPEIVAVAHMHTTHARAFSALGKKLSPIDQDAVPFHHAHAYYAYNDSDTPAEDVQHTIEALGHYRAILLKNHGLFTLGTSVDAAAFSFVVFERQCQVQLLAEAANGGKPTLVISEKQALLLSDPSQFAFTEYVAWLQFQPMYAEAVKNHPDLLA